MANEYELLTSYKRWSTRDVPEQAQLVETISLVHPSFEDGAFYICDYGQEFVATNENGINIKYIPIAFTLDLPQFGGDTSQGIRLTIDAVNPVIYEVLSSMDPDDRLTPITLINRTYLDNLPQQMAVFPPPKLTVESVEFGLTSVEIMASNSFLPQRRSGTPYDNIQFPTLVYI